MDFEVGDRIIMKKPHPCGSKEWEVLRVGIDFPIFTCQIILSLIFNKAFDVFDRIV